jgi:hypothetical protein
MLRLCSILMIGLISLNALNVFASTKIIFSLAPPPDREIVVPPRGYINCHLVQAGYYHGMWVNQHRVCQYSRHNSGVWISGHWQCTNLIPGQNVCLSWNWVPARWDRKQAAAYGIPVQPIARPVVYAPPAAQPHPTVVSRSPATYSQPVPVVAQPQAVPAVRVAVN